MTESTSIEAHDLSEDAFRQLTHDSVEYDGARR
jgi:hypothetical protein